MRYDGPAQSIMLSLPLIVPVRICTGADCVATYEMLMMAWGRGRDPLDGRACQVHQLFVLQTFLGEFNLKFKTFEEDVLLLVALRIYEVSWSRLRKINPRDSIQVLKIKLNSAIVWGNDHQLHPSQMKARGNFETQALKGMQWGSRLGKLMGN